MEKISTEQFVAEWQKHGRAEPIAEAYGMHPRAVMKRRSVLQREGHHLPSRPAPGYESRVPEHLQDDAWTFPREKPVWLHDGVAVISSDHHYQPGPASVAHRALIEVIKITKPRLKVVNGDVFDGGSIGRHPPFGWVQRPTPVQELHACQERLGEIEQAVPRGCQLIYTIGNHDIRWERTLASQVDQFVGLHGLRLADHFSSWDFAWSVPINWESQHPVMVKHRFANGIHAAYNNSVKGGVTIVTGHTHCLEVKPIADYRGRRWGIQCGTIADLDGPAFEYTERNPSNACAGFAVLTFKGGNLLPPELCEVIGGKAYFRGEVVA